MTRLLVPGAVSGRVEVTGERLHYLSRVLRLNVGATLEVFDGAGHCFDARVTRLDEVAAQLELGDARAVPALRPVTVVQGLPKGDKLELVLQKATELGATGFAPVSCERSVVKLDGKEAHKQARWQRIVEEAARQCGRADVPAVALPTSLVEGVRALGDVSVLVLDEEEHAVPLSEAVRALPASRPLALVVGPEGGLARTEVSALVKHGARTVTLGRLILRTETAALAALSVVRHLDGDLG